MAHPKRKQSKTRTAKNSRQGCSSYFGNLPKLRRMARFTHRMPRMWLL